MSTPKPAGGYHSGGFIPPVSTTIHVPPKFTPTPTPIYPADIRPGDVVEIREVVTVVEVDDIVGPVVSSQGKPGRTWHLVHRPDPDAEAVEVMEAIGMTYVRTYLDELRKRGWDVTRRQNGQEHA